MGDESKGSLPLPDEMTLGASHLYDNTQCDLCGSVESSTVRVGVRFDARAEVRRCISCGLVYIYPRPRREKLQEYYQLIYRAEYHGTIAPEKTYKKTLAEAKLRVSRLMADISPSISVVDVGASSGAFLESIRPYVGTVTGVEPDEAHRKWAESTLRLKIVPCLSDLGQTTFNLITVFHTLEHIPDPVGFLKELSSYLTFGGKIVVEVPNVTDALLTLYHIEAFADLYYQSAHLYYFSEKTLARAICSADGKPAIRGVQRYDLGNHLHWMLSGQAGGQGMYRDVLTDEVQAAYSQALIRSDCSDTLWAVISF